jgi:hypothetical protein
MSETDLNDLAVKSTDEKRKVPNAVPCGVMVRLSNPEAPYGCDIYCPNLVFGHEFKLKAGSFIECDLEMAKAAKRNWGFLNYEKIGNASSVTPPPVNIPEGSKVDLDRYTPGQIRSIVSGLGKLDRTMKKEDHLRIVEEATTEEIVQSLRLKQIPVYIAD